GVVGGVLGRGPGEAAVGGGAHLDAVAVTVVVELGVAVAVVRAGGRVVASGPVLVQVLAAAGGRHGDRVAPGEPAVGGAADQHRRPQDAGLVRAHLRADAAARRITPLLSGRGGLLDPQRGDQPGVVLGVVGDRGVANPVE